MANLPASDCGVDEKMGADLSAFMKQADEASLKAAVLDQKLREVEQFYSAANKKQVDKPRGISTARDKDKERYIANLKKRQLDPLEREAAAARRMQELMRLFDFILSKLTQHKWAEPFLRPVDVEGLGLTDYYQVIKEPMDFATIESKMKAKDGTGYKNVREICADVRLIFKNAMKYNEERSDVHVMAKDMLAKFEESWLQLLPKVDEEENRRREEEAEALLEMQLVQEANFAKITKELCNEIDVAESSLEELKNAVLQNSRKMTHGEKDAISRALTQLTHDELQMAMMIISEDDPAFQATGEEVDIDLDAQSEFTLWRLKYFTRDVLQRRDKAVAVAGSGSNINRQINNYSSSAQVPQKKMKRGP